MRLFLIALLGGPVAHAAEPVVTEAEDGTVKLVQELAASPERVRAVLGDPIASSKLSDDVLDIEVVPKGTCQLVTISTRGMFRPLVCTYERCPTATGWREELSRSDDFREYFVDWAVEPAGEATRVTYQVRSVVNLKVPKAMVQREVRKSAKEVLVALEAAANAP